MYDVVISGATLVTMDDKRQVIVNGMICISGRDIVYVGPARDVDAAQFIDARGKLVMPGLINAHTHISMTLFRGVADDLPLDRWLSQCIWLLEQRFVTRESVRWGAQLACAEMIRSGTTTCADTYFYADEVAGVIERVGMRAMVGEAISDNVIENGMVRTRALLEKWLGHERITPVIAPRICYACDADAVRAALDLASRFGVRMHIHMAETADEVRESLQKHGVTPVQYLEQLNFFQVPILAAHGVWLSDEDVQLLAHRGVAVVLAPGSNMKLADGIAPWPILKKAGLYLGLGTDGVASNNNLDMFQAMTFAARLFKVASGDPSIISAQQVVELATITGAQALGLDDKVGSLEPVKRADLIIIDLAQPHLVPSYGVYSTLAYGVKASDVTSVMVNGRILMQKRQLLTIDESEVMHKVQAYVSAISDMRNNCVGGKNE